MGRGCLLWVRFWVGLVLSLGFFSGCSSRRGVFSFIFGSGKLGLGRLIIIVRLVFKFEF